MARSATAASSSAELKVLRQRLHDQLNRLCPGLSAPQGHGRALDLLRPSGRAVLACAVAFAGRAPALRSLLARAPGRLRRSNAEYWLEQWRACLAPPADAELRAQRLGLDLERLDVLLAALANADGQLTTLLAQTQGQVLTSRLGRRTASGRRFPNDPDAPAALLDALERLCTTASSRPKTREQLLPAWSRQISPETHRVPVGESSRASHKNAS